VRLDAAGPSGNTLLSREEQEEAMAFKLQLMTVAFVFLFLGAVVVGVF
jgi:hypothetical protein